MEHVTWGGGDFEYEKQYIYFFIYYLYIMFSINEMHVSPHFTEVRCMQTAEVIGKIIIK